MVRLRVGLVHSWDVDRKKNRDNNQSKKTPNHSFALVVNWKLQEKHVTHQREKTSSLWLKLLMNEIWNTLGTGSVDFIIIFTNFKEHVDAASLQRLVSLVT